MLECIKAIICKNHLIIQKSNFIKYIYKNSLNYLQIFTVCISEDYQGALPFESFLFMAKKKTMLIASKSSKRKTPLKEKTKFKDQHQAKQNNKVIRKDVKIKKIKSQTKQNEKKCKLIDQQEKKSIHLQLNQDKRIQNVNPCKTFIVDDKNQQISIQQECPHSNNKKYELDQDQIQQIQSNEQLVKENEQDIINNENKESKIAITLHAYKNKIQQKPDAFEFNHNQKLSYQSQQSLIDDLIPNQQEILQCIQMLKECLPNINIFKIITVLYVNLIQKRENGQTIKRVLANPKFSPSLLDGKSLQLKTNSMKHFQENMKAISQAGTDTAKRRFYTPDENENKFQTEQDEIRYNEKKIVAKAFCNRDYGMAALQDQILHSGPKISIQKNRYKSIVCAVATEAYRRLERFLMYELERNIKPLNRQEMRSVYIILLNCRKNFETEQCLTFYKFVKIVYNICSVSITEEAAIKLYIVIQKALKVRISEIHLDRIFDTMRCNKQFKAKRSFQNERFQLHKIWTNELQIELLELYKRTQQLVKIRDYFKHKYLQNQHLFTLESLRSRLHKILRVALRKVNCFCQKFGQQRIPNLIKLNDVKVKLILRCPDAINARLLLVEMYLYDECDIKRLYQTVSAINEFIIMKDNERINQIIQAEPLANSASQKIKHNVIISKNKLKQNCGQKGDDQIYLMGRQQNYHHIVRVENGKNLHYYRKVEGVHNQNGQNNGKNIKLQQQYLCKTIQAQTIYNQFKQYNCSDKLNEFSNDEYQRQLFNQNQHTTDAARSEVQQNSLQFMIRDEMKKYLGNGKADQFSNYG